MGAAAEAEEGGCAKKFDSIHCFSARAISRPTLSALALISASISRSSSDRRFLAQMVCRTPLGPGVTDLQIGDHVVMANNATLGGHAQVGDKVFLGGLCAVHQNGRVGQGAIVGGLAAVTRDVIPYGSVWGNHASLHGLNLIGLKRKGYGKDAVRRLLAAYRDLFEGDGVFAERLDHVETTYADLPEIMEIVVFIRDGAKRPLCLPGKE